MLTAFFIAEIQIKGGYIHYLRSGENLSLECTVNGHVESHESLHWTRGKHVMSPRHRSVCQLFYKQISLINLQNMIINVIF